MGYKKIGDYGIIGNGVTVSLVGADGSIDWLCLPAMDSASVFGALLDAEKGGRFSIAPVEAWDSVQRYLPKTNILQTLFRTEGGEIELVDFMPAGPLTDEDPSHRGRVLRRIRGLRGRLRVGVECSARFEYGRERAEWWKLDDWRWRLRGGENSLVLWCSRNAEWERERTTLEIDAGETVWLSGTHGEPSYAMNVELAEELLRATKEYWEKWTVSQELGVYPRHGFWEESLDRAALVLKLLQMRETGAIAAAATTSLPPIIHGERNWDYRFSWVRDTAMTLSVLFHLGHLKEVAHYFDWVEQILEECQMEGLHPVYCLRRPEAPSKEIHLKHLSGYKNSRPVRVGQFDERQHQHDVYGDLLDMLFTVSKSLGKIAPEDWELVRPLVDHVCGIWREKDFGVWEMRIGPHHNTHSKLMCWVALDRGVKLAEQYGFPADLQRWKTEREAVREDVLMRGYCERLGRFRQRYETEALDAALLRIPLTGFLPVEDERVARTIAAVEKELLVEGVVLRYTEEDGLAGQEHGFMICLFWYLRCLILQGRLDEVENRLRGVNAYSNSLGLFGEQFDPRFREITGNFPQALSHLGYAQTVLEFEEARRRKPEPVYSRWRDKLRLLFGPKVLTPPEGKRLSSEGPVARAGELMNHLRGEFYDGHRKQIDYAFIRGTEFYRDLEEFSGSLKELDWGVLREDGEKRAFGINLFNLLVVHAVLKLGIHRSVKEAPRFFDRVQYWIGGERFSLNGIWHGILRGNRPPPLRMRAPFRGSDRRKRHAVRQVDARIHFALAPGSRTAPPLDTYTTGKLNEQLDSSARVFINTYSKLAREEKRLKIPELFGFYERDFERSGARLVEYIAGYWYDAKAADWMREEAARIKILFLPTDWRLNRMEREREVPS